MCHSVCTCEFMQTFVFYQSHPSDPIPSRPEFGSLGNPISLQTNSFRLYATNDAIFDYAVSPTTALPYTSVSRRRLIRERMMRVILEHSRIKPYIAGIAHDGSQRILSVQQLPQPLEIDVDFQYRQDADPVVITVDIILVHKLNTKVLRECVLITLITMSAPSDACLRYVAGNPQHRGHNIHPMLSALSIIIKQHATRNAGPPTRKQPDTWYNETRREPAGPCIEALVGVSFSIYPTLGYLNLNIGPQKSLFHCPGNLADMMLANRQESTTMFKWLRILANRPGMDPSSIIVTRVANATARQSPMIDSNMTVEDYFRTSMYHYSGSQSPCSCSN